MIEQKIKQDRVIHAAASFLIIAVCMEYNWTIEPPFGKITSLLFASITIFYLVVIDADTFEGIEDTDLFGNSIFISNPKN